LAVVVLRVPLLEMVQQAVLVLAVLEVLVDFVPLVAVLVF
jgi:hypothetical protein